MIRRALAIAAFGVLCAPAFADPASTENIKKALAELAPNSKVDSVQPSAVPGMFEVTVDGSHVLYVSNDGRYIMQGVLFDTKEKKNLTDVRQAVLRKELMQTIPVKDRIVFSPKDGKVKHRVAVFTDPDCGYCRKLHHEMADYNARGIEIQYLAWPRAGMTSDTGRKMVAIWCDKDPQDALTKAKDGGDPGNATCTNPVEQELQLGMRLGINGTPAMVFEDGTMQPGYMPAADLEARLDQIPAK